MATRPPPEHAPRMSQPQDPRRYDRLVEELSRIRDPQALARAIVAAAREQQEPSQPQPAAPQPGQRGWIEA